MACTAVDESADDEAGGSTSDAIAAHETVAYQFDEIVKSVNPKTTGANEWRGVLVRDEQGHNYFVAQALAASGDGLQPVYEVVFTEGSKTVGFRAANADAASGTLRDGKVVLEGLTSIDPVDVGNDLQKLLKALDARTKLMPRPNEVRPAALSS